MMNKESVSTIRGDVAPLIGAGEGRVVVVTNDMEYRVEPKGAGADLAGHLSEAVEVTGVVMQDEDGVSRIRVRTYRLLDVLDDDAWYEDERD